MKAYIKILVICAALMGGATVFADPQKLTALATSMQELHDATHKITPAVAQQSEKLSTMQMIGAQVAAIGAKLKGWWRGKSDVVEIDLEKGVKRVGEEYAQLPW